MFFLCDEMKRENQKIQKVSKVMNIFYYDFHADSEVQISTCKTVFSLPSMNDNQSVTLTFFQLVTKSVRVIMKITVECNSPFTRAIFAATLTTIVVAILVIVKNW